jgi:hypothetical protein
MRDEIMHLHHRIGMTIWVPFALGTPCCAADRGHVTHVGGVAVVVGTRYADVGVLTQDPATHRLHVTLNGVAVPLPAGTRGVFVDLRAGDDRWENETGYDPATGAIPTIVRGGPGDDTLAAGEGPLDGYDQLYGDGGADALIGDPISDRLVQDDADQVPGDYRVDVLAGATVLHGFQGDRGGHHVSVVPGGSSDGVINAQVTVDGSSGFGVLYGPDVPGAALVVDLPGTDDVVTNTTGLSVVAYGAAGSTVRGATYRVIDLGR